MAKKKRMNIQDAKIEMKSKLDEAFPDKPKFVEVKIFDDKTQEYNVRSYDLQEIMIAPPDVQIMFFNAREKAMILEARRSFWDFCLYMDAKFFNTRKSYMMDICQVFQDTYDGKFKRVSMSLCARAGKSYITSLFSAWHLGKKPERSIIRASYGMDLAEQFSDDIRKMIQEKKYRNVFPKIQLRKDKRALKAWALEDARQFSYITATPDSGLTGKSGSGVMIIDDIYKNMDEALNERQNEKIMQWFNSVFMTRRENDPPIICLFTRWQLSDLIGTLSDMQFFDKEILVPALNSDGKSFCPEIEEFSEEELLDTKQRLERTDQAHVWDAMYMQNPQSEKALLYPPKKMQYYHLDEIKDKEADATIGFIDVADKGADYLAFVIGRVFGKEVYIVDVVYNQQDAKVNIDACATAIRRWGVNRVVVESNNAGNLFHENLKDKLIDYPCIVDPRITSSNKETRILLHAPYVRTYFRFRKDEYLNTEYLAALRHLIVFKRDFKKNIHDDIADASTGLYLALGESTASIELWD